MIKEYSLEGKVAIITGAGRGIGRAIALTLAEAGADIVAASRTIEELKVTAKEILNIGRKCLTIPTDVTNLENLKKLVDITVLEFNKIDILVNNAGMGFLRLTIPIPGAEEMRIAKIINDLNKPLTEEEWEKIWSTNFKGAYNLIKLVVPYMIKNGKGKIINIVSSAAIKYTALQGIYPATKAAIVAITRNLANELARFNINVNCIGPGGVRTSMLEKIISNEELSKEFLKSVPLRRYGEPREVGLLALYLASEASDYMTGQTLYLDGGYTIS